GRPPVTDTSAGQLTAAPAKTGDMSTRAPTRDFKARVEPKLEPKPEPKFEPKVEPKAEPREPATQGKNLYENLEQEMASLLARPRGKWGGQLPADVSVQRWGWWGSRESPSPRQRQPLRRTSAPTTRQARALSLRQLVPAFMTSKLKRASKSAPYSFLPFVIVVCCGFRVRLDGHDDPTADHGIAAIQANLLRGGGRPETGHRLATPDMAPSHAHDARSASYSSEQNGPP